MIRSRARAPIQRARLPVSTCNGFWSAETSRLMPKWMHQTFDIFWDYAQWVVKWTNSLVVPPASQILQLMSAASQIPPLARKIANGFDNPPDHSPWWFNQ